MEQSVNQFNKGLQMDSHPMVQGNDTLTDALNATFITMNGNEVVLQNDMGNRRIDNAYLPAGYEPVGIKEYGGVIYVAAYNPITGRGQVGSFPSPQRKLFIGNNQGEDLDLNMFIEQIPGGLYKIATRNITIPISDDVVLHTGDKFSVYSNGISNLKQYLTKPGDVKNNLFTFQIGLFNSQNEFVDISDKLKLKNLGTELDPYDYYIWDDNGVNDLSHSINDAEFNKNRNALAINTYSYKMSSPLYLRAILNAPTNITYNIDGERDGNNLTIFLEVTYTYNCLDNINDNYFNILFNNTQYSPQGTFNSVYNEEQDNYSVTLNYEFTVQNNTSQFHYDIDFLLLNNYSEWSSKNIILSEFSVSADLDTSKLHTDLVELNGYRYYVDTNNKKITLDIDINSYPKKNSSYDIYPVIYKDGQVYELTEYKLPTTDNKPKSGTYQLEIYYDTIISAQHNNSLTGFTIEYGHKYEIRFKQYGTVTTNNIVNAQGIPASGLLIITPLFNGNYIGTSSYKSTTLTNDGGYNYDLAKNDYIKDFSTIKYLILSPILSTTNSQQIYDRTIQKDGQYVYELSESEEKKYNIKESYISDTNINVGVTLNDVELYPQEVLNALQLDSVNINNIYRYINGNTVNIDNNNNSEYSENLTEIRGDYYNETTDPVIEITQHNAVNNNIIQIQSDITINNYVKGGLVENNNIICSRVITSLFDFVKSSYFSKNNNLRCNIEPPYICIDWEGTDHIEVVVDSAMFKNNTFGENGTSVLSPNYTKSNQNQINEILKSNSENFLLLDYNSADIAIGDGPGFIADKTNEHTQGIRKIWMKVSEKEYTPVMVEQWAPASNENLEEVVFNLNYNSNGGQNVTPPIKTIINPFAYVFTKIPHYYAYSQDGITLDKNIINYQRLIKTKEFNITSSLKVLLTGTVTLNNDNNSYFQLENQSYTTDANVEIPEPNLESIEGIDEYLEKISNLNFDCVLSRPTTNLYDTERVIEYEDREGNLFDPLYIYYQFDETDSSSKFQKSYKAKTFYTSDLKQNMPELKSSNELFHASNGRVHPYINPDVISSVERQELVVRSKIGWLTNENVMASKVTDLRSGEFLTVKSESSYLTVDYPPFMVDNPPLHPNQYYWDKDFTYAQYEENNPMFVWTPLTCKNIFNQESIREFKLYKNINENNDCPINSSWKSADECYNLLESS